MKRTRNYNRTRDKKRDNGASFIESRRPDPAKFDKDWTRVAEEYTYQNPDDPIGRQTARDVCLSALEKVRRALCPGKVVKEYIVEDDIEENPVTMDEVLVAACYIHLTTPKDVVASSGMALVPRNIQAAKRCFIGYCRESLHMSPQKKTRAIATILDVSIGAAYSQWERWQDFDADKRIMLLDKMDAIIERNRLCKTGK